MNLNLKSAEANLTWKGNIRILMCSEVFGTFKVKLRYKQNVLVAGRQGLGYWLSMNREIFFQLR